MPLYEYLCESCGRTMEAIQSFSDPPLTMCDRCGGAVKKLLSAPAVQFKGSGWYVSDYGKGGSKPGAKGAEGESSTSSEQKADAKSDAAKGESKSDAKGETKSEGKSEAKPESAAKKPDAA